MNYIHIYDQSNYHVINLTPPQNVLSTVFIEFLHDWSIPRLRLGLKLRTRLLNAAFIPAHLSNKLKWVFIKPFYGHCLIYHVSLKSNLKILHQHCPYLTFQYYYYYGYIIIIIVLCKNLELLLNFKLMTLWNNYQLVIANTSSKNVDIVANFTP